MKKDGKIKDSDKLKHRTVLTAQYVTHVAVMAGLITALKFALSFLPNVELITLFIAVFSALWGIKYSLPATIVFCLVEMAIYGIGSWVLLYFIYWPILAVVYHFVLRNKKPAVAMGLSVAVAVPFTVLFGVLSACTETLFVVGAVSQDMLGTYFVSYYLKGLWFDIVHIISVTASILLLYIPLHKICEKIRGGIIPTGAGQAENIVVDIVEEDDFREDIQEDFVFDEEYSTKEQDEK